MRYTVYVKTDETNRITDINSSAFLEDTDGFTAIGEGAGDRFYHAQGNYFPLPLRTEAGVCRYKLEEGQAIERAPAEIEADAAALPEPEETTPVTWDALAAAYQEGVNKA